MNLNVATLLPVVVAVLTSIAVPLIIFFYTKRASLRQLNTTSDATIVTSAATLVASLQNQIKVLDEKAAQLEGEQRHDRAGFITELNRSHDETLRVSTMVAQLKTDLDICHRRITELQHRIDDDTSPSGTFNT